MELLPFLLSRLDVLEWLTWSLSAPIETSLLCLSLRLVASAVGIATEKTIIALLDLQ